ncbi:hypothetical protein [Paenibacillus selenitireducens]|nr:hypothetical protein [Paenibacillus selenitireducens]
MKDWVQLLTALIQLITAYILLRESRKKNKKGTKRTPPRKR